jgi:hypothetical protein
MSLSASMFFFFGKAPNTRGKGGGGEGVEQRICRSGAEMGKRLGALVVVGEYGDLMMTVIIEGSLRRVCVGYRIDIQPGVCLHHFREDHHGT